jgi:1-pyrroline-5-carboxylate dehydrogenase
LADAHIKTPPPRNEPVMSFAPGTPERPRVKARYAEMADARTEIPMRIGGRHVMTKARGSIRAPHQHQLVVGEHAIAEPSHVTAAINAALAARAGWAATPYHARAAVMLRAAELLAGPYRDSINAATMLGQSKTVHQAEIDAACETIDFWRFNVHYGDFILAQQPQSDPTAWNRLEYRPLEGFVFAVSPFNFTSIAGNLPTAPALMGNTVVFKPSRETLLACHVLLDVLEAAGLPPGVINMVSGDAAAIGAQVIDHPSLAGIHFTGSTEVFQWMWQRVGGQVDRYRTYPRLVGETGGKDFVVAHESADTSALMTGLVRGAFEYQGQKCSAASRAYIPASMWKRIRRDFTDQVDSIPVGDVADFGNFMGAVINQGAFKRHRSAIAAAKAARNARVVAGGDTDGKVGWFVRPTVIEADSPSYRTMREELFGPILTVYPYPDREFEKTLDLVDSGTRYGLTGAIFATDRTVIKQVSDRLVDAAGNFYVNDKPTGAMVGLQPFGGARASGTNDKAGSYLNLLRWASARTVKETYVPPTDYRYPYMGKESPDV